MKRGNVVLVDWPSSDRTGSTGTRTDPNCQREADMDRHPERLMATGTLYGMIEGMALGLILHQNIVASINAAFVCGGWGGVLGLIIWRCERQRRRELTVGLLVLFLSIDLAGGYLLTTLMGSRLSDPVPLFFTIPGLASGAHRFLTRPAPDTEKEESTNDEPIVLVFRSQTGKETVLVFRREQINDEDGTP
jgi:hypothetical protein